MSVAIRPFKKKYLITARISDLSIVKTMLEALTVVDHQTDTKHLSDLTHHVSACDA